MKFLHAGDIHLGAEPEGGTALGTVRKGELWDAFRDIIEICNKENIDLLLLPGDLFHGQPLLREVKEVDYLFGTLIHTRVVMCAGNHDCLLPTSHYYDVTFPDHVTFLMDPQADSVYLPELNVEVFGLSYDTRQIDEARYDALQSTDKSRINILLAHGNILCNDKSIPLHRGVLESAGFDYVALGHIHNRIEVSPHIAYSGSLEPLNRGETGAKGYILGEITKEGTGPSKIHREFVPHAKREYVPLDFPVTADTTEFSLCSELFAKLREQGLSHMFLITLTGTRAREVVWNLESITAVLAKYGANVIELADKTVPDFAVERLREQEQDTLVGRFINRMDGVEDEKIKNLALQYGLQALLARDEKR
ncbi:MAG: DNA repair exonuclease [Lachnospiraceae bacterium]|nr:DNA repair exonuclease [Lachnospiraceae bacterium]